MKRGNPSRRGREFLRMLSIDAAFNGMPAMRDGPVQNVVHAFAHGEQDLALHQIHIGHHFGDGVLHLDAGVHLDEIQSSLLVH